MTSARTKDIEQTQTAIRWLLKCDTKDLCSKATVQKCDCGYMQNIMIKLYETNHRHKHTHTSHKWMQTQLGKCE